MMLYQSGGNPWLNLKLVCGTSLLISKHGVIFASHVLAHACSRILVAILRELEI
jgi:hypothetical protein